MDSSRRPRRHAIPSQRGIARIPSPPSSSSTFRSRTKRRGDAATIFLSIMGAAMGQGRIAIKTKGSILLIDTAEVSAIEARGSHVLVRRTPGSLPLRASMSTVEKELAAYGFVRVHRSLVVNSAWVLEIFSTSAGEWMLRMRSGEQYAVSRSYRRNIRLLAQSWIGIERAAVEDEGPERRVTS